MIKNFLSNSLIIARKIKLRTENSILCTVFKTPTFDTITFDLTAAKIFQGSHSKKFIVFVFPKNRKKYGMDKLIHQFLRVIFLIFIYLLWGFSSF